ncbi:hypothetical protein H7Q97_16520 [Ochrobactrum sp. CM-21-5]|nr:hypothetical protein [Ochrobactrum sp. CM-21-5]MBC2886990.1 hypothetical protein [Ochrobactrum sp. CM-21-5]
MKLGLIRFSNPLFRGRRKCSPCFIRQQLFIKLDFFFFYFVSVHDFPEQTRFQHLFGSKRLTQGEKRGSPCCSPGICGKSKLDAMQLSEIMEVVAPDMFKRPIYADNAPPITASSAISSPSCRSLLVRFEWIFRRKIWYEL